MSKDKKKRKEWKENQGYHKRSLVETCMYRYKKIFSERLAFRKKAIVKLKHFQLVRC